MRVPLDAVTVWTVLCDGLNFEPGISGVFGTRAAAEAYVRAEHHSLFPHGTLYTREFKTLMQFEDNENKIWWTLQEFEVQG